MKAPSIVPFAIFLLAGALLKGAEPGVASSEGDTFFETRVRPILERACFDCHSHASGKMKNGLTLDSRSGWATGGDSGPAVVPGDPEKSLLLKAVRYGDPDLRMPPKRQLPEEDIAVLEEWVRRGAPDPRIDRGAARPLDRGANWWSLRPLARPALPIQGAHPVDAFINARLREEGLTPAPEANRRALIRRLVFDLHGLTPSLSEVEAFERDAHPRAYERLLDRLLASPRYGERWARHWLDAIHFADTHGFEHDLMRTNAWRYRDYTIESFNRDTPWPRFVREQLAADAFFPEEPRLTVALGFLGAGPWDQSTAQTAPRTFEYLDRDDIVTQTMATFTSSTVNCARCHDHKFDPISQEDYYALQSVFAGVGRGDVLFDEDPARARERKRWNRLAAAAMNREAAVLLTDENATRVESWLRERGPEADWHTLAPDVFVTAGGAILRQTESGTLVAQGPRPETDTYTLTATPDVAFITAIRLEVLPDPSLPKNGPGRQDNGNLHLSEITLQVFPPSGRQAERLIIRRASSDFDQEGWTVQHAFDGNEKTAWGIHPREGEAHMAVFELESPVRLTEGARLAIQLKQLHGQGHLIGKFRLSVTGDAPSRAMVFPADVVEALRKPAGERSTDQKLAIAAHISRLIAEARLAPLPPPQRVFGAGPSFVAVAEGGFYKPWSEPKAVHVLKRGDIGQAGAAAVPGAMSAVAALPSRFSWVTNASEAERRKALAEWIAAEENPLTWRSIVNRVWARHFGVGLVDTLNDFGRMGSAPSHPELLDWLACEFRDGGGSLKALHRLILTSAAYRRAASPDPAAAARDPDNRLLWRWTSQRLDAESFRDSVLALAGSLDLKMGGPGVQQFKLGKPIQLTPTVDYSPFDWDSAGAGRRSIYRFVYRGLPDPFLEALDFPDAAQLAPVRLFSASPLQALTLWNSDFVLHHCAKAAARLERQYTTCGERVQAAVTSAWLRLPDPAEQREFAAFAEQHGLAALCRVLLNSNEFLFID